MSRPAFPNRRWPGFPAEARRGVQVIVDKVRNGGIVDARAWHSGQVERDTPGFAFDVCFPRAVVKLSTKSSDVECQIWR